MPATISATAVPLFDRLNGRVEGSVDGVWLDAAGIRRSLMRELTELFQARSGLTIAQYLSREITVLDYGLPDCSTLSVQSETDRQTLSAVLEKALAVFEPRLSRTRVAVQALVGEPNRVRVTIQAAVMLDRQERRVDFELDASAQGISWTN